MTLSPYVSVRESAQILGVTDGRIMQLIEQRKLQAYRIAGQYLRLKRSDVMQLKNSGDVVAETVKFPYTARERFLDFLLYNDFYIAAFLIIGVLILVVMFWR
jgi:excisionase family DNA binding protein